MFSDEQTMLCLAGISYRGFYKYQVGPLDFEVLRPPIERGLRTISPLRGRFDLVWGPARYRSSLSVLDEKLMYVVRDRQLPQRYVVVVRGTNPISVSDWLFGDLWTGRQMSWRYGTGAEKVSLSAALSLAILRGMRSAGPRDSGLTRLWSNLDERVSALRQSTARALYPLRYLSASLLRPLQRRLFEVLQQLGQVSSPSSDASPELTVERLLECAALWRSRALSLAFDLIERIARLAGDDLDRALLSLIERDAMLQSSHLAGVTLPEFLSAAIEDAEGPLEVVVAGHSKGGALASTLALWLAETQGTGVPDDEQWDPGRRAIVHCYSFAGPTAGNAAFVDRSNTLLGARCHRIWNRRDIVPLAWDATDLGTVPALYAPQIAPLGVVQSLVHLLVSKVGALNYRQLRGTVRPLDGDLAPDKPNFFAQLLHQHLDAYLLKLGLGEHGITQAVLFDETIPSF
jgi:hypothetical protein